MQNTRQDIINKLRKDILLMEGFKPPSAGGAGGIGLGEIELAFPNRVFPVGAIHEMLCPATEQIAATSGFIGGILASLMKQGGACIWISTGRKIFPPAMTVFNMEPDRMIFIDLKREKDVLWAAEEALKCEGLAAVIAELQDISFAESRRLQLAVENSKVTGFILRNDSRKARASTCVARWQITHLPGETEGGLPGVGYPRWQVDLLKVRNGNPGSWQIEWAERRFVQLDKEAAVHEIFERQVG
ncbi:MAG TPA: Error-prone repair protein ImuA [Mucilaginibacter sp.]|jgi:protein ImuA|nr:Error-prone repair protein ImuA [Mucilaginibacter sp.]